MRPESDKQRKPRKRILWNLAVCLVLFAGIMALLIPTFYRAYIAFGSYQLSMKSVSEYSSIRFPKSAKLQNSLKLAGKDMYFHAKVKIASRDTNELIKQLKSAGSLEPWSYEQVNEIDFSEPWWDIKKYGPKHVRSLFFRSHGPEHYLHSYIFLTPVDHGSTLVYILCY